MPLFVVQCTDNDNILEKRMEVRPQHLKRLDVLKQQGRLIVAGPMPKDADDTSKGFYGSVIIVDFDSHDALDQWLADEPYVHAGVYKSVDVKPFIKVFPKDE
ncbi:YciI family protein [Acinetobacter populi]|uniref:YCII-related domain-containing protein n=1 Tax=Acinetobacter populi TaxID=1582270 RepID=A0A1Z9YUG0_9GAMM|nr:YciI family protein [Acinetobacter populi]OUY05799.1 hypothetical protein CAP51_16430 [Acinetobacter populi]